MIASAIRWGLPAPTFADEHWSSENCNPFSSFQGYTFGKLLSCGRVQHETQLKPSSKSKQAACDAPDSCASVTNRSIADCEISSAIKRVPRKSAASRNKVPSQSLQYQYRAEHRVSHTVSW